jgi:3-hydroxyacyl-[acyl-carrier-protein] dehydratase
MALIIDPDLPQADVLTIKRMIPHRYPFLLIDRVVNMAVGVSAVGL